MEILEFCRLALRTEAPHLEAFARIAENPSLIRLLHAQMGLCTEVGEFADALKRHIFYGKPLDQTNAGEEIGDICWYLALAGDALGVNIPIVLGAIIEKLRVRFPEKYSDASALSRDLGGERTKTTSIIVNQRGPGYGVALPPIFRLEQDIGDTKAGTMVGYDCYGNLCKEVE